jgi:predicted ATPase
VRNTGEGETIAASYSAPCAMQGESKSHALLIASACVHIAHHACTCTCSCVQGSPAHRLHTSQTAARRFAAARHPFSHATSCSQHCHFYYLINILDRIMIGQSQKKKELKRPSGSHKKTRHANAAYFSCKNMAEQTAHLRKCFPSLQRVCNRGIVPEMQREAALQPARGINQRTNNTSTTTF